MIFVHLNQKNKREVSQSRASFDSRRNRKSTYSHNYLQNTMVTHAIVRGALLIQVTLD